jgi:hypothetical protein
MPSDDPAKRNTKPDTAKDAPQRDASEFERFTDLARKLLHVPKKELDEKRKAKR